LAFSFLGDHKNQSETHLMAQDVASTCINDAIIVKKTLNNRRGSYYKVMDAKVHEQVCEFNLGEHIKSRSTV